MSSPSSSPPPSSSPSPPSSRSLFHSFLLGGLATTSATLFTNPIEVIKTRMQIQGENNVKIYRNMFHAAVTIGKREGIRGLQGGLGTAMAYQLMMNGTRLALYGKIKGKYEEIEKEGRNYIWRQKHKQYENMNITLSSPSSPSSVFSGPPIPISSSILIQIAAGSTSGILSAAIGAPFFLLKVRLQVANHNKIQNVNPSLSPSVSVGNQHHYKGAVNGFFTIIREEGVMGLYRGVTASMLRVGIGSGVQLATYDSCKALIMNKFHMGDTTTTHLLSSLLSGIFVTVAMNPADVLSARMVNQKGEMYKGIGDCMKKIYFGEGIKGFYRGVGPHYARLGPHTCLTFLFWEKAKQMANEYGY